MPEDTLTYTKATMVFGIHSQIHQGYQLIPRKQKKPQQQLQNKWAFNLDLKSLMG